MTFRTFLFAGAAASLLATPLLAVDQDTLDAIIAEFSGQGFTKLEIKDYGLMVKVEATGPNGKLERLYNAAGGIVREETGGMDDDSDDEDDLTDGLDDDEDEDDDDRSGRDDDDEDDDDDRSDDDDDKDDDKDDDDDNGKDGDDD